jgi:hypothetical protein
MSNSNWKSKLSKPSKRKQVYNTKEKRWLNEEEEAELLKMLKEKHDKIKELTNGQDPEQFLAQEHAKAMAEDALLKKDEDEPSKD